MRVHLGLSLLQVAEDGLIGAYWSQINIFCYFPIGYFSSKNTLSRKKVFSSASVYSSALSIPGQQQPFFSLVAEGFSAFGELNSEVFFPQHFLPWIAHIVGVFLARFNFILKGLVRKEQPRVFFISLLLENRKGDFPIRWLVPLFRRFF